MFGRKKLVVKHAIIFLLLAAYIIVMQLTGFGCPIRRMTGIPCPGCGLTRAYISLFRFDIKEAFIYHPLFPLIPLILFAGIHQNSNLLAKIPKKALEWFILGGCLLVIIVYLLRLFIFHNIPY